MNEKELWTNTIDGYTDNLKNKALWWCRLELMRLYTQSQENDLDTPDHVKGMLSKAFQILLDRLATTHNPGSKEVPASSTGKGDQL